ncbi:aspartate dehydrogenase domain-containing protein [Brevibacterium renqingii]|uniref:aspartate dehydrogenase domain-containing protein n=1 Tax=Brevibacterium renqingii TaxID=2776916 RepID=UPI001AE0BFC6|nr:aspartate dehydrogenase domain-containing protein [Brevibacterium renqingii]
MTTVLLLGFGAIGRHVAQLLAPELGAGTVHLTALVSDPSKHADRPNHGAEIVDLAALSDRSGAPSDRLSETVTESPSPRLFAGFDVVVECAGVPAAAELGPAVVVAGRPLVLTSVGALADPDTRAGLLAGPGRLLVTNGAIGGLDVLEAAAQADALDTVEITTSKEATGLIRPWMTTAEADRLRELRPEDGPLTVFAGDPAEAIEKFPANVNIAVALAWATRGLPDIGTGADTATDADSVTDQSSASSRSDAALLAASLRRVRVELHAVAGQSRSTHRIRAAGAAGEFAFDIRSTPSPENPATSGLTALSVARTLRQVLAG